ncbi:sugar phosphate nucleotidyl transferase [Thermoproteus uzoniensis 768-20]|uniref:Sugar phosphate nucleotidyl transferase n=1 Tax=Thermoproteus uzoniensis (strain 768-20) TaxID=999630 RepID=F2L5N3_THEU7|nr:sugar phosphate nucleotidyl transferase [Thermoproteus uzoniensis]AEA13579.1 sugar phosphate nucleotidyl transferase [Thermoproteus uzoniensis 768-20]
MELALVGQLRPRLLIPPPLAVVGGFRIAELVALALCDKADRVTIYVEGRDLGLPLALGRYCRLELRYGEIPPDVPRIDVSVAPYLLRAGSVDCEGVRADLGLGGGVLRECKPLETYADLVANNVDVMRSAIARLKELGVDLLRGEAGGVVKGEAVIWGKTHEYTYVVGPAVIGPESEVLPFSYIRQGTALYYGVRARDEVKNSIVDAYTYKEHHGYLGDSYVSAFVNFGAGTTVSNLKNTLGPIRPSYSNRHYAKLGPVIGEFVKTAIGTLIYGGKYIGPLSHVYGLVDTDVPPLVIYRDGEIRAMDGAKIPQLLERDLSRFGLGQKAAEYLKALEELTATTDK